MQRAGADSLYAFLFAAARWPVTAACQQGDLVPVTHSSLIEYLRDRADLALVERVGFHQLCELAARVHPGEERKP